MVRTAGHGVESLSDRPARRRTYLIRGARPPVHDSYPDHGGSRDRVDVRVVELDRVDGSSGGDDRHDGATPSTHARRRSCARSRAARPGRRGHGDSGAVLHARADWAVRYWHLMSTEFRVQSAKLALSPELCTLHSAL